ncbi:replication initiation protein [Streptomyces rimosus subsp. rimosus ATCC 10970]|uniref:Replication initiation protein n=1 Tax=Streptomyces rimosus subsp. rimosus (strain ATCC 10970 / DSM 40260 / JCM 4667 / NRRL 2234) TaxID=1265868 RepID=A0A8A1V4X4_STRR1|nr:replication initiation protein [Streptomyces sp. SID5471]QDA05817.1 replication initiation protein [Streptomyces rimosus]QGY65231.1 replication initiation protein [Streptomyces rimosus R6-500]QST86042.1 replication initiation protein [Streptomyces rimosus subsp. rimosus ATCC 10970]QTL87929.1 replication initiation protein [Streptomyces rimosus subsp. rimosus]
MAALGALASTGRLPALARQLSTLGGCTRPIRLEGHRTEHALNPKTGEIGAVLHRLGSTDLPTGQLLTRCNNRRTTRCAACAEVYRRDTYQLITARLRGGKGNPETVTSHPRVFATFTAPGFGPVHNRPTSRGIVRKCRCGVVHDQEDEALGTPLDPATYDYAAAVLWNAHAGMLWRRFSIYLRREIAKRAGLTQREFPNVARVSFAKVAEYQKRGAVHFHAVIRIDGPFGGHSAPPAWATVELLTDAIEAAAARAEVSGPVVDGREHSFVFGRQLDIRPIRSSAFDGSSELTERAVAGYIAKYATKGAETATGTLDRPLRFLAELSWARISDHAERMIRTAWALGARKDLADLRLRAWAHMLGFRGHFSTKTRHYSTTLGALRTARAECRRLQALAALPEDQRPAGHDQEDEEPTTYVLAHWVFAGTGLAPGEEWLSASLEPALGTEGEPTR